LDQVLDFFFIQYHRRHFVVVDLIVDFAASTGKLVVLLLLNQPSIALILFSLLLSPLVPRSLMDIILVGVKVIHGLCSWDGLGTMWLGLRNGRGLCRCWQILIEYVED
jgi:hypothetical protein